MFFFCCASIFLPFIPSSLLPSFLRSASSFPASARTSSAAALSALYNLRTSKLKREELNPGIHNMKKKSPNQKGSRRGGGYQPQKQQQQQQPQDEEDKRRSPHPNGGGRRPVASEEDLLEMIHRPPSQRKPRGGKQQRYDAAPQRGDHDLDWPEYDPEAMESVMQGLAAAGGKRKNQRSQRNPQPPKKPIVVTKGPHGIPPASFPTTCSYGRTCFFTFCILAIISPRGFISLPCGP